MPTTRSRSKGISLVNEALEGDRQASQVVKSSPRYCTRSRARSLPNREAPLSQSSDRRRLSFDERDGNTSQKGNIQVPLPHAPAAPLTPTMQGSSSVHTPVMNSSEWDAEISPIPLSRSSDASEEINWNVSSGQDSCRDIESEEVFSPDGNPGEMGSGKVALSFACNNGAAKIEDPEAQSVATLSHDLSNAWKEVGQSSQDFIERIRSAAHRRKVAMARSRDSLVAKEQKQLRSIAEAKTKAADDMAGSQTSETGNLIDHRRAQSAATHSAAHFKARPLPPTTGVLGSGGLDGVPKVEKKATTTPFSPLLGPRRKEKIKIKALLAPKQLNCKSEIRQEPVLRPQKVSTKRTTTDTFVPFRARPIPAAVTSIGHGGQSGVPKVAKRPVTVANSPLLGPRRRSKSVRICRKPQEVNFRRTQLTDSEGVLEGQQRTRDPSNKVKSTRIVSGCTQSTASSPLLLGLKLLDVTTADPIVGNENVTPKNSTILPYEPHSTARAKKRAEYDIRRNTIFQIRTADKQQEMSREIQRIHKELDTLRKNL